MIIAGVSHLYPSLTDWMFWGVYFSVFAGLIMKVNFKIGFIVMILICVATTAYVINTDEDVSDVLNEERGYHYGMVSACLFNITLVGCGLFVWILLKKVQGALERPDLNAERKTDTSTRPSDPNPDSP